jgi:hypothetical protein
MAEELTRDEVRMNEMFDAAHRDRNLKQRLLTDPEAVAKEWGVVLGQTEVARLKKIGTFAEMAAEAKIGSLFRHCDPRVCYPSTVWLAQEVYELIEIFVPKPPTPGYPAPIMTKESLLSKFGGFTRLSDRLRG